MRTIAKAGLFVLVTVAALTMTAPAQAQLDYCFVAGLDGATVSPPSGSAGSGHASIFLNEAQDTITYFAEFSGVDTVTSIGIYDASDNLVVSLPMTSPLYGSAPFPAASVAGLFAEELYIQINTEMYPEGAIRGYLVFCAVGSEPSTMGTVKSLFR
jgi:hypothetical protein